MSSTFNKKYDFTGKVALVTGSSSGIGAAIAIQLAQYGAKVTITGRNAEALEKIAQEMTKVSGGVEPLQIVGDLLDDSLPAKLINETVAKFGRLDVLVNNAGGTVRYGNLASPQLLKEFDQVMSLNLRSVVALIQLAVPHLEVTRGNIINISSISAIAPFALVYSASKAALDMVTKTAALELGSKGIRVNSVNPGAVRTQFSRSRNWTQAQIDDYYPALAQLMPLKYIASAHDIANLVVFLASDDARNMTGGIYVSDGGNLLVGVAPNKTILPKTV